MGSKPVHKPDIIIVEDNLIFRQVLKSIISVEKLARVIGEASNGLEFIDLLSKLNPDLVLIDIDMPEMNGIEATQKALVINPDLKIIALTQYGEVEYYNNMVVFGARGFILKSKGIWELEKAMKEVMEGRMYFSKDVMGKTSKVKGVVNNIKSTVKANK
jgi:DNA-binding NarL/FixJ family response regulator